MGNSRFKFRAWDKVNKKMYNVKRIGFNDVFETSTICADITNNDILESANEYILMQCAGLKDKNGVLIYEGDIVKINTSKAKDEIFFIQYEISNFIIVRNYQILDAWYEMFIECWSDDIYPLSQLWINEYQDEFFDCLEIIGNIYENPELLENN